MTETQTATYRSGGTVALCQFALEDLAVDVNYEQVRNCVSELDDDVDIALFPEHTLTGFTSDNRIEQVPLSRNSGHIAALHALAEQTRTSLVVGFVEVDDGMFYNATACIDWRGDLTVYCKQHLWEGEQEVLTACDELVTVETRLGTAGLPTCYELNFVEDSAVFARKEVQALLMISAWPSAYSEN